MTMSAFSLGDAAISQLTPIVETKKTPTKRTAVALADRKAVPEPR